jgi:hypothetical protein
MSNIKVISVSSNNMRPVFGGAVSVRASNLNAMVGILMVSHFPQ